MPSKKKKYNARFPAGRIKKIMQTDEEVGKVAQAVPIIISRTLELFVESLLTKTMLITESRNAKTLTPSHLKQCIQSESRFDFLKDLVRNIPDASIQEDNENNARFDDQSIANEHTSSSPLSLQLAASPTAAAVESPIVRTPVIQFQPKVETVSSSSENGGEPKNESASDASRQLRSHSRRAHHTTEPPPLIPIANNSTPKSLPSSATKDSSSSSSDDDDNN